MKTITIDGKQWQLVPVEPDDSLQDATYTGPGGQSWPMRKAIYAAFLAAAPEAPEQAYSIPFNILESEIAALKRFDECANDGEGYDVPKRMMKRLAGIGLLHHTSAGYYEHTTFGLAVLNGLISSQEAPAQDAKDDALGLARIRLQDVVTGYEELDFDLQSASRDCKEAIAAIDKAMKEQGK